MGDTVFSLVTDPVVQADLIFLKRRALLHFFKSPFSEDSGGLVRVAQDIHLMRYLVEFV